MNSKIGMVLVTEERKFLRELRKLLITLDIHLIFLNFSDNPYFLGMKNFFNKPTVSKKHMFVSI